ncbi:hypothetical protein [Streptomyces griseosporeus]|uniref:hypothetical protein n=1 Tax=Streptomyces griseosporeus TaxID=1910 RepID=UPI0036B1C03D
MTQQYPQQPQQPQPYGAPGQAPVPPKKRKAGKIAGLGCLGVIAIGVIAGVAGGSSDSDDKGGKDKAAVAEGQAKTGESKKPAAGSGAADKNDSGKKSDDAKKDDAKKKVVVFKVWGTAPAGALGPLDITYGSDSDTRQGSFKNGKFEATLPLDDKAMYYNVMAQLQGSGDINCSVTVDGETKKGHAAGGYNICDAQLSSGLLGGWD